MYQIKDWAENFETAKTISYKNKSNFILPLKSGLGYKILIRMDNGPALYGAFVALIAALSKQNPPRKGLLSDNGEATGRPWGDYEVSIVTEMPQPLIKQMLEAISSKSIGWLDTYGSVSPQSPDSLLTGDQQDTLVSLHSNSNLNSNSNSNSLAGSEIKLDAFGIPIEPPEPDPISGIPDAVVILWNEVFPEKQCKIVSQQIREGIKICINLQPQFSELAKWRELLSVCRESDFLMNRLADWFDLSWLVSPTNFKKIACEGKMIGGTGLKAAPTVASMRESILAQQEIFKQQKEKILGARRAHA